MPELTVFDQMRGIDEATRLEAVFGGDKALAEKVAQHRIWLKSIRRERPSTSRHFKVGIYIRYFNQTKYDNYLDYHKKQFEDTLAQCPNWEFIGFYIDEGQSPPNMESAPEWCRLLNDACDGKVDLIITQKVSNVSKKPYEVTLCSRFLAVHKPPIGIYFISEDIFTLASYYLEDLHDDWFFPSPDWKCLPDDEDEVTDERGLLHD